MRSGASSLAHTLYYVILLIWVVAEFRQATQRRPEGKAADQGSQAVVRLSYLGGIVAAVICNNSFPALAITPTALASWVGLIFLWFGVALRLWSFRTLGRYFTFTVQTSEDQQVISAGPYRVIRHPGYAGLLLAFFGVGFIIGNWASLAVLTVAVTCGLVYRIIVEERSLSRDLGGRYQAYAKSRKRLVPYIW
jgi:protein-S-isoprenylcysteine O-methyltransferase Ste14